MIPTDTDTDAAVAVAATVAAVVAPVVPVVVDALPPAPLNLDALDPVVAVATWGLTQAAAHFMPKDKAVRRIIPALAVAIAIGLRTGIEAVQGHALTGDVLLRAVGSGMAAIALHSQGREVVKATRKRPIVPPEVH